MDAGQALMVHDLLLENQPEGARHDSDICTFCADKAAQGNSPSRIPHGTDAGPDVSEDKSQSNESGGRDTEPMSDTNSTISQETHEALLKKAVDDAVRASDEALQRLTAELTTAKTEIAQLTEAKTALETDNADLNKKLDDIEVAKNTAEERASKAEQELEQTKDAASKAELASKRADQVRNLKLFTDEQVAEKANRWAEMSDEDWSERLDEWAALKPTADADANADTASAMSGTSEALTTSTTDTAAEDKGKSTTTSPRRAALGLA